jgi:hypothetical protein
MGDIWIYRLVVISLGSVMIAGMVGTIILALHPQANARVPDMFTALGSAAMGALAGLLTPLPAGRRE